VFQDIPGICKIHFKKNPLSCWASIAGCRLVCQGKGRHNIWLFWIVLLPAYAESHGLVRQNCGGLARRMCGGFRRRMWRCHALARGAPRVGLGMIPRLMSQGFLGYALMELNAFFPDMVCESVSEPRGPFSLYLSFHLCRLLSPLCCLSLGFCMRASNCSSLSPDFLTFSIGHTPLTSGFCSLTPDI